MINQDKNNSTAISTLVRIAKEVASEVIQDANLKFNIPNVLIALFFISYVFAILTDWFFLTVLGLVFMYLAFFFFAIPTICYCFKPSKKLALFLEKQGLRMQFRQRNNPASKFVSRNIDFARVVFGVFLSLFVLGSIVLISLMFS